MLHETPRTERETPAAGEVQGERTWAQALFAEWLDPPPRSDWAQQVDDNRITHQDRIRPFTTRGLLLSVIAGCLVLLHVSGWWLMLLGLGALQTVLEVIYEPAVRFKHEHVAETSSRGRLLVRIWYWNYAHWIANVTGIIGLLACVANLLAVVFGTGPATSMVWLKVLALTCAILYANSGALGPLMDASAYSPESKLKPPVWRVLRALWLPVAVAIACVIWFSERSTGAWGAALPYALMAVGLIYYPMLRIREFERAMAAGRSVSSQQASENNSAAALELHNLLQPVKGALRKAADALTNPREREEVLRYITEVEYIYKAARTRSLHLGDGLTMPLAAHLKQIADGGLVTLTTDIHLDRDLLPEHYGHAKQWLLAFTQNSVQAYAAWTGLERPFLNVSATQQDLTVTLEVSDALALIPEAEWDRTDSTLGMIRADIQARGGTLTQTATQPLGKTIRAQWPTIAPLRVRNPPLS